MIKLPATLVWYTVLLVKWLHAKMASTKLNSSAPLHGVVRLALRTSMFNCSAAQKHIGHSPVVSLETLISALQSVLQEDFKATEIEDKLAMNISTEQGKTLNGAKSDVLCGLEMVEHACGMASLQMGEFVPSASNGIDTYYIREPLGVCAGICPFNFPAMISLWMFPIAVTCGNTFILKPSEKNSGQWASCYDSFPTLRPVQRCMGYSLTKADKKDVVGLQEQVFVRKVIKLHDKYMAYVNNCFMNHTLFHKALKEAFEVFCNKGVGGSSSAELLATFCDNILKKGGSEKLSDEAIEGTLEKVVKLLILLMSMREVS